MVSISKRTSMALFSDAGDHYCQRVRIVLEEKGIASEIIDADKNNHNRHLSKSLDEVLKNSAEDAIRMAVKGMLPKNKLGKKMLTKLKIYKDAEHPHQAQNPSIVDI